MPFASQYLRSSSRPRSSASPGLDRKLTKPVEFERFSGRLARITTNEPIENQKFFEGRLAGAVDGPHRALAEALLEDELATDVAPQQRVGRRLRRARGRQVGG